MTPDLDELERAARAATPGPWEVDGIDTEGEYGSGDDTASGYVEYGLYTAEGHLIVSTEYRAGELTMISEEYNDDGGVIAWNELARRDALFLAAANPAAILSLIARLRTAEAALAGAREVMADIAAAHIPSVPAACGPVDDLTWAQQHVGTLRRMALNWLAQEAKKETPESEGRMTLVHRGPPAEPMKNMSVGCPQAVVVPATPGCQTAQRAAAAEAENERLREALREIEAGVYEAYNPETDAECEAMMDADTMQQIARAALQEAQGDA